MCLSHLEELWLQENFKAMLDFCDHLHLLPMQDKGGIEEFLPFILAKVYYRLAETNAAEYLPDAITFWLTVIHNPTYLIPPALREQEGVSDAASQDQLTRDLQQKLEQLVQHYRTSSERHDPSRLLQGRKKQGREKPVKENRGRQKPGKGEIRKGKSGKGKSGREKPRRTRSERSRSGRSRSRRSRSGRRGPTERDTDPLGNGAKVY